MIKDLTYYDEATGLILWSIGIPEEQIAIQDQNFVEGVFDSNTHYVLDGVATIRPSIDYTVIADPYTISGLPIPCTATIDKVPYEITDGDIEITFDLSGNHVVQLEAFPYLSVTIEVVT